jgi:hypothetical protein
MNEVWTQIFSGEVEGRNVTLSRYTSGELRVTTTQKYTEATEASSDGITHVFPVVISEGDTIEVDATTAQELESELQQVGFSAQAAQQIVAHA